MGEKEVQKQWWRAGEVNKLMNELSEGEKLVKSIAEMRELPLRENKDRVYKESI